MILSRLWKKLAWCQYQKQRITNPVSQNNIDSEQIKSDWINDWINVKYFKYSCAKSVVFTAKQNSTANIIGSGKVNIKSKTKKKLNFITVEVSTKNFQGYWCILFKVRSIAFNKYSLGNLPFVLVIFVSEIKNSGVIKSYKDMIRIHWVLIQMWIPVFPSVFINSFN